MFTPTLRCECAQPGLIDTMRKWSIHPGQPTISQHGQDEIYIFRTTYLYRNRICGPHSKLLVRDIVHYWSQINPTVNCISLLCVFIKVILIFFFRKDYQGLKSDFWQLIPRWSNGLVVWLMIIGLGFDSPHNLIKKKYTNFQSEKISKK